MSLNTEVELVCDDVPALGCPASTPFYALTGAQARQSARATGWLTGAPGGKDYCPAHRHLASTDTRSYPGGEQA